MARAGASNFFIADARSTGTFGSSPSTERGYNVHLGTHPKENKVIYCSGKNVVVRSIDDPSDCFVYRGHNAATTVAKFAPNGYWVCSADSSGKIMVWSWDNPEHIVKYEGILMAGKITDLEWGPESKKITVAGDGGGGLSCKTIMWDSGNAVGEMIGHTANVLSIAYKPSRPYRVLSAGEDNAVIMYNGPPFRQAHTSRDHSNYVQCVRFAPDGKTAASVSNDKKIIFYDAKEGTVTGTIDNAHAGSIYSCSWSPDSTMLATSSADKKVKVWNVETKEAVAEFTDGTDLTNMKVGVVYKEDKIISLSLGGDITVWQVGQDAPLVVFQGHQTPIVAAAVDSESGTIFTGSSDGVCCYWNAGVGSKFGGQIPRSITGAIHGGRVAGMAFTASGVVSAGYDDTIRFADLGSHAYGESTGTTGQPIGIDAVGPSSDTFALVTSEGIFVHQGTACAAHLENLGYEALCVAMNGAGDTVAVGAKNMNIYIYSFDGSSLTQTNMVSGHRGEVSSLAFSPCGGFLAAGDSYKEVRVHKTEDWSIKIQGRWVFHTSRVTCLSWSPNGINLASGSNDTKVIIWNLKKTLKKKELNYVHMGGVNDVAYLDENTLVTVGNDQCVCTWNLAEE
uniref:Anaphase-promoting complex subunit 4 WD40 domain-containing protein n=1 Tax=Phaeomonas parva TaxID=124430 RepID=A0A7S1U9R9_9STRA|mmetsp:Transcript_38203/g.119889  ORF Transcript_38203/g.119889 Transcript_38203/m.119889 type:complete len:620 (+) Transcript_38203:140-1999(+)|eukprot:CAMPEP_0118861626 /NCGR_PEP_ID=MMETSP1163-20130328/7094_1 /TAXON_ID=124430 /ORGANISM="Phaeomonas parva, Strain CCMP2877" /LENGTH=619 /DNA_ID=CAMNT_0006795457 /DNA_START=91 /DNA_END=1950 /DNA_ORIENTATION=-